MHWELDGFHQRAALTRDVTECVEGGTPQNPAAQSDVEVVTAASVVYASLLHFPDAAYLAAILRSGLFALAERASDGLQSSSVGVGQAATLSNADTRPELAEELTRGPKNVAAALRRVGY